MTSITVNGSIGSGALEFGNHLAKELRYDYVDRLVLSHAAKELGSTVQALAGKEQSTTGRLDGLASLIQRILERSAMSGSIGDPYFGPGIESILANDYYAEPAPTVLTQPHQIDDQTYFDVMSSVFQELANANRQVIVGRASNMFTQHLPNILHLCIVSTLESRIKTVMERERLDHKSAAAFVSSHDSLRQGYYSRFFNTDPSNPTNYHITLNTNFVDIGTGILIIKTALALVSDPLTGEPANHA